MLLIDVSNLMYTGSSFSFDYFGSSNQFKIRSIPYFFKKIASYYSVDQDMVAVFEKVGRTPALATNGGYKSGRQRNPMVEWETAALREILEFIGFPILEVEGQEADYIINNYCRIHGKHQHIGILSADHDMASNIRSDVFSTQMLSFSSASYNINKYNFKEITGVPYNFMDLHKILRGCSSDKIKPFPDGDRIFEDYYANLETVWKIMYGYDKKTQSPADFFDNILEQYNSYENFMNWFKFSSYYSEESKEQLDKRRRLIEGPQFELPKVGKVNWRKYNQLIRSINMSSTCSIKSINLENYNEYVYTQVENILTRAKSANTNMFEGSLEIIEEVEGVSNVANIIGILEKEGGL